MEYELLDNFISKQIARKKINKLKKASKKTFATESYTEIFDSSTKILKFIRL